DPAMSPASTASRAGASTVDARQRGYERSERGGEQGSTASRAGASTVDARQGGLYDLEDESVHILREVVATFERPVLLFSGGKDSAVMLELARKAFWPAPLPFALMHIDTGRNFDEVIEFRDHTAARLGARLLVASVQDDIDA